MCRSPTHACRFGLTCGPTAFRTRGKLSLSRCVAFTHSLSPHEADLPHKCMLSPFHPTHFAVTIDTNKYCCTVWSRRNRWGAGLNVFEIPSVNPPPPPKLLRWAVDNMYVHAYDMYVVKVDGDSSRWCMWCYHHSTAAARGDFDDSFLLFCGHCLQV